MRGIMASMRPRGIPRGKLLHVRTPAGQTGELQ